MIPLNIVDHKSNKLTSLEVIIKEHINNDLYIGPRSVDTFKDGHAIDWNVTIISQIEPTAVQKDTKTQHTFDIQRTVHRDIFLL
jgi:hypothetical protein